MTIRQEQPKDFSAVFELIEKAFESLEMSDHREQYLVERLRKSDAFVPELSLVAEVDRKIVGYILLTKISIKDQLNAHSSLALAPVAVAPEFQGQGIGEQLIERAHDEAIKKGFESVVILGHPDYYHRFGYRKAAEFGIRLPFDVPEEYCLAKELIANGLKNKSGVVEYNQAFGE